MSTDIKLLKQNGVAIYPETSGQAVHMDSGKTLEQELIDYASNITTDSTLVPGSTNPVQSQAIQAALAAKADEFEIDDNPQTGSTNPVSSGGVADALDNKADVSHTHSDITNALASKANAADVRSVPDNGLTGQMLVQTATDYKWVSAGSGLKYDSAEENITVHLSGNDFYTDQEGMIHLNRAIPSGGVTGQVLKKTAEGYEWGTDNVGENLTVDASFINASTNPVQSRVIAAALASKVNYTDIDAEPTETSENPVSSGGVYDALASKADAQAVTNALNDKANVSHTHPVDATLIPASTNPIQNHAVAVELAKKLNIVDIDTELSDGSENPVQNQVITEALALKANVNHTHSNMLTAPSGGTVGQVLKKTADGYEWGTDNVGEGLTVDSTWVNASTNPVQSRVIAAALASKVNYTDIDAELDDTSENPIQNQAVTSALNLKQNASITDTGNYFIATNVEGALQEIGAELSGINTLLGGGVVS